jgi:hypothetical protein
MFFSRGANKVQNPYTIRDMYKDYLEENPEGSQYYVTRNEFTYLVSEFYNLITDAIINQSARFVMPYALGEIFVIKRRLFYNDKMPIDWKATVETGHTVYNFNTHTGGYTYKFYWKKNQRLKNKFTYGFAFTRQHKRALAKAIKENKMDYLEK